MSPDDVETLKQAAETVFAWMGPYHTERTYQNALQLELGEGTTTKEEVFPITYKYKYVGFQRIDLTWQGHILEIKSIAAISKRERGQCERYLRTIRRDVALINFSPDGVQLEVFDDKEVV